MIVKISLTTFKKFLKFFILNLVFKNIKFYKFCLGNFDLNRFHKKVIKYDIKS